MELYLAKPSLVRVFYFKSAIDFSFYHTHDMQLDLRRDSVIYLYRDPVDTIYSQLVYCRESLDDDGKRRHWVAQYASHLSKWLVHEAFTTAKTIVTYEGLKSNAYREIGAICRHLGTDFESGRLDWALAQISKSVVSEKTRHDPQVVNQTDSYGDGRDRFRRTYGRRILQDLYAIEPSLERFFDERSP